MNGDALQSVYDETSAAAERNTPGASRDPADLEWLERVRRLRWAAAWAATPGSATPTMPPLPPGGGGGGGGLVARNAGPGGTDNDAPPNDTRAATDEAEGGSDTTTPIDDGTKSDTTDNADQDSSDSNVVMALTATAAALTSKASGDLFIAVASSTLLYASGPLSPAWAIIKETWTQVDGVLSCSANASGKAIALYAGQIMAGLHQAAITRPAGTIANAGPTLCCSVNASGQTSGYCSVVAGASLTMWRIDADVWTSIGTVLHGGYTVGMSLAIQRNGGNIRAFVNGVLKLDIADATYTSGYGGVGATNTGQVANLWSNA